MSLLELQYGGSSNEQVNVLLYLTYLSTSTHCGCFPFHYHIYMYTDYRCRYIPTLFTISPTCPQAIAADCFTISPTCPQTIAGDRFTVSSTYPTDHRCSLFRNLSHLSVQNQSLWLFYYFIYMSTGYRSWLIHCLPHLSTDYRCWLFHYFTYMSTDYCCWLFRCLTYLFHRPLLLIVFLFHLNYLCKSLWLFHHLNYLCKNNCC